MGARGSKCFSPASRETESAGVAEIAASGAQARGAQGEVQKAFATATDWESVFEALAENRIVQEYYGDLLANQTAAEAKILQVRTLVPIAKAAYARKAGALEAKRTGVLEGYRTFAEKKGIQWRADAKTLESRGEYMWEAERAAIRRKLDMPAYYKACYEGALHSYNNGNGEWMAAFDAPSAYLLVHLHHYPDLSPQEAFDALHEEFDLLALKHLAVGSGRPLRCVDIGSGVGTSTFSTVRSLERAGRSGSVTGIDLSDYFITVAKHIQQQRQGERTGSVKLDFVHGDGLDLASLGFEDGSLDMVMVSEVTHEMPKAVSESLFVEAARVLAPGGVLGYLDLNPAQILKENAVGNLVDRIATRNEPYFDEYLELDVAAAVQKAGLEVLEETWPNHNKYHTLESCSLRILVARKPVAVTSVGTWMGKWALDRRENWSVYLTFLGVPEAAHEMASKAEDFHEYVVKGASFFMEHRIPAQKLFLRFTAFLDGEWHISPYAKPTATGFDKDSQTKEQENRWKHSWVQYPTCFETTIPDFAGKGKTVILRRELASVDQIKYTVHVLDPDTQEKLIGPCYAYMKRTSVEPPKNVVDELKERFATGCSRSLEWRQQQIDKCAALVLENVDAWSEAQAADHVSPSSFQGAAMMCKAAVPYYKANLEAWAAPQVKQETLPPFMQTPGTWEVVPEPKGVGLVIAPWNANVLLCALPLLGMLAAGNMCILKPSEAAPRTSRLLARLVPKYFPDRSVVVAEGGRETVEELINARVDHILFTGGGEVAKNILALAAKHLTPCSLELGGKNPCFVDAAPPDQLALYVAEIVGTKSYFAGQFCQAHDYCLVHESVFDEFVKLVEEKIAALGERRMCRMINAVHAKRVKALLQGQEEKARPSLPVDVPEDCVPLTALLSPSPESPVMQREIFGPLLPIFKVADSQEAMKFVAQRPKPLVAYCYSPEPSAADGFKSSTSSGVLAVNCGPQRSQSNFNVGFGGVGDSGYGHSIWGRAAFDDYSHHRAVFNGTKFAGSVWGAAPPQGPPPAPTAASS